MGVTLFEPPGLPRDELLREAAIEASGALLIRGDDELQHLAEQARVQLGTAMAAVSIVYRDWQYLIAAAGIPVGTYSRRTSLCGHAILHPERLLYVPDAAHDPRFADNPVVAEDRLLRFYLGAPLIDRHGMTLGTLCVFDPRPRPQMPGADGDTLIRLADAVIDRLALLNGRIAQDASASLS